MVPLLLLLAAAPQMTAVDAERAFAADAQKDGQWTAFRRWAADDATMFAPQPVKTQAFLKDRRDPPKAIAWWPVASYVSCDGKLAVNTGGWERPDGTVGYFSTVWLRQADGGWKWIVDGGDALATPRERPATPAIKRAACPVKPLLLGMPPESHDNAVGNGMSGDGTLLWHWSVSANGERHFRTSMWDGQALHAVIDDHIAGSPPNR